MKPVNAAHLIYKDTLTEMVWLETAPQELVQEVLLLADVVVQEVVETLDALLEQAEQLVVVVVVEVVGVEADVEAVVDVEVEADNLIEMLYVC